MGFRNGFLLSVVAVAVLIVACVALRPSGAVSDAIIKNIDAITGPARSGITFHSTKG